MWEAPIDFCSEAVAKSIAWSMYVLCTPIYTHMTAMATPPAPKMERRGQVPENALRILSVHRYLDKSSARFEYLLHCL